MSFIQQDLTAQARGDTWNLQFNMQDVDGNVLDVTGNQYWFTLKSDVGVTDAQADLQLGPVVIPGAEAAQGIVKITVSGASTDILAPATYNYDLQIESYNLDILCENIINDESTTCIKPSKSIIPFL